MQTVRSAPEGKKLRFLCVCMDF